MSYFVLNITNVMFWKIIFFQLFKAHGAFSDVAKDVNIPWKTTKWNLRTQTVSNMLHKVLWYQLPRYKKTNIDRPEIGTFSVIHDKFQNMHEYEAEIFGLHVTIKKIRAFIWNQKCTTFSFALGA